MKRTTMRVAEPRDMPALLQKLREQNERDGTCYPMAELFDKDGNQDRFVPLALVIEHGRSVAGGIIFESAGRGVEMMLIGCSPRITLMAESGRQSIEYTLKRLGFQWIRSFVTKSVVEYLEAPLGQAGFRRTDHQFAAFFKELDGGQN